LVSSTITLRGIEVVVADLVRDEVAAIDRPAEPFERIVERGDDLDVLDRRSATNGEHRQGVLEAAGYGRAARELDPHVAEGAAVVVVVRAAAVGLGIRRRRLGLGTLRQIRGRVADDRDAAPVAGQPLAEWPTRREDDRSIGGAIGDDAPTATDKEQRRRRVDVTEDHRARLNGQRGAGHDFGDATEDVLTVGNERSTRWDRSDENCVAATSCLRVRLDDHARSRDVGAPHSTDPVVVRRRRCEPGIVVVEGCGRRQLGERPITDGALDPIRHGSFHRSEYHTHADGGRRHGLDVFRGREGSVRAGRVVARGEKQSRQNSGAEMCS
jgi:hypothetical protein